MLPRGSREIRPNGSQESTRSDTVDGCLTHHPALCQMHPPNGTLPIGILAVHEGEHLAGDFDEHLSQRLGERLHSLGSLGE